MTTLAGESGALLTEAGRISREVAARHADEVDHDARFPIEAINALREAGALSALVPVELGGGGLRLTDVAGACLALARGCSATAMIFAMHQLQVATIVRHRDAEGWHRAYLTRLAEQQRLVGSATSEMGTGGDMGRSVAALTPSSEGTLSFEKRAPTVSYGDHCDDLLTSLRRDPDARGTEQVMVLHARAQTELFPEGAWDTLGMRGTCSPGFRLRASVAPEQILPAPFATMMEQTIVPISHLLWAHVWLGIATEAFSRAHAFVRASAHRSPGEPVAAARPLAEEMLELRLLRSEVATSLEAFEAADAAGAVALGGALGALRFNSLKLVVSERVPRICSSLLGAVGIMAYRNDSPYSLGRLLRDALSGQLMIANERIHTMNASFLTILKEI